ncbi:MAG: hypothetical protein SGI74_01955 [Oligoflexia bacterium]|nr:hypothetical protein [Oligoflexia bacterium]
MTNFYLATTSLALVLSLASPVQAQEIEALTITVDGEEFLVHPAVLEAYENSPELQKAIAEIDARETSATPIMDAAERIIEQDTKSENQANDKSQEFSSTFPGKIWAIITYKDAMKKSIEKNFSPIQAAAFYPLVGALNVQVCRARGLSTGDCVKRVGIGQGRRYIKDIVGINRMINKIPAGESGGKKFVKISKFLLKQGSNYAWSLGQRSLEKRWGVYDSGSRFENHIRGTLEGAHYALLRATDAMPFIPNSLPNK